MKNCLTIPLVCLLGMLVAVPAGLRAADQTSAKVTSAVKDLDTPREFPKIASLDEWQNRAKQIRQHVLVSCGLWPVPEKTPLNAHVFGKIERDGYSVEKVYFQTFPGFYLGGNLYRPFGRGPGPFPGILNPHGHWSNGRMADNKDGSIAARCISFARQGMVAFSYDMVGFNDTFFPDHGDVPADKFYLRHNRFATNRVNLLWNISLMGLQTWDSIRALDFLESLPDVDRRRLACTGESGGGTQTFMLGAVEDRLAAQAPIVMVSHTMQGGCLCENAPGLRVEYSNMELSAAAAPRPQILVAATGDWTKDTLTVEGPSIGHIYELFKAPEKFHYERFDFGHNYNQTSREAVYRWFDQWLLGTQDAAVKEPPYQKEPDSELRVWPDGKLPSDAVSEAQFIAALVQKHEAQWNALLPHDKASLDKYKAVFLPAWRHTLQIESPTIFTEVAWKPGKQTRNWTCSSLELTRPGETARTTLLYFAPSRAPAQTATPPKLVVLAPAEGSSAYCDDNNEPQGLAKRLLERRIPVLLVKAFSPPLAADQFTKYYSAYNRTLAQARVRDLVTACAHGASLGSGGVRAQVILCGLGRAGLWSLLAAPAADAVIADAAQFEPADDQAMLGQDLFCPGIRNLGSFEGVALLAAPRAVLLHNTGVGFATDKLRSAYRALGASRKVRVESEHASDDAMLKWISSLR